MGKFCVRTEWMIPCEPWTSNRVIYPIFHSLLGKANGQCGNWCYTFNQLCINSKINLVYSNAAQVIIIFRPTEAVALRCSVKKSFLINSKILQENTCATSCFNKIEGLSPLMLFKSRLWLFPLNFAKFLRASLEDCIWTYSNYTFKISSSTKKMKNIAQIVLQFDFFFSRNLKLNGNTLFISKVTFNLYPMILRNQPKSKTTFSQRIQRL